MSEHAISLKNNMLRIFSRTNTKRSGTMSEETGSITST